MKVALILLFLACVSCYQYQWSVFMYNDAICQKVLSGSCNYCHNSYYKIICGTDGPDYNYWIGDITTASDCFYYMYTESGCNGEFQKSRIQAYSSREDVCDQIVNKYGSELCWFGATTADYDPFLESQIFLFAGVIIGIITVILIVFGIIIYKKREFIKYKYEQYRMRKYSQV